MGLLTASMLSNGWAEAKAVQHVLDTKGFWSCDLTLAVNRKFAQKLKEQVEIDAGGDDGDPATETFDVERIVSAERKVVGQERTYVVKWVGYPPDKNTVEPESHLLTCKELVSFWKSKRPKNNTELARVTKLQEAALGEREEASRRRVQPLPVGVECAPSAATTDPPGRAAVSTTRPAYVPTACKAVYDHAHNCLGEAYCLVLDSETGGFGVSVIQLGWILATVDGSELVAYEKLWRLPAGERIHSKAFKAHGITDSGEASPRRRRHKA
jgi:hypothetical protein